MNRPFYEIPSRGVALIIVLTAVMVMAIILSTVHLYSRAGYQKSERDRVGQTLEYLVRSGLNVAEQKLLTGRWYGRTSYHGTLVIDQFPVEHLKGAKITINAYDYTPAEKVAIGAFRYRMLDHIKILVEATFRGQTSYGTGKFIMAPEPLLSGESTDGVDPTGATPSRSPLTLKRMIHHQVLHWPDIKIGTETINWADTASPTIFGEINSREKCSWFLNGEIWKGDFCPEFAEVEAGTDGLRSSKKALEASATGDETLTREQAKKLLGPNLRLEAYWKATSQDPSTIMEQNLNSLERGRFEIFREIDQRTVPPPTRRQSFLHWLNINIAKESWECNFFVIEILRRFFLTTQWDIDLCEKKAAVASTSLVLHEIPRKNMTDGRRKALSIALGPGHPQEIREGKDFLPIFAREGGTVATDRYFSQRGFQWLDFLDDFGVLWLDKDPTVKMEQLLWDRQPVRTRVMAPRDFCTEFGKIKTGNSYSFQWKCTLVSQVQEKNSAGGTSTRLVTRQIVGEPTASGVADFLHYYENPDLWRPNGGKLEYTASGPIPIYSSYFMVGQNGKELPLISVMQFFMKYVCEYGTFTPKDEVKDENWCIEKIPAASLTPELTGDIWTG